jgi:hypothetical protein
MNATEADDAAGNVEQSPPCETGVREIVIQSVGVSLALANVV